MRTSLDQRRAVIIGLLIFLCAAISASAQTVGDDVEVLQDPETMPVTIPEVTGIHELCGPNNDWFDFPVLPEGIEYFTLSGWVDNSTTFTYYAAEGYHIEGPNSQVITDRNIDCILVIPVAPTQTMVCGGNNDLISRPDQPVGIESFEYSDWEDNRYVISYWPAEGYAIPDGDETFMFTDSGECPEVSEPTSTPTPTPTPTPTQTPSPTVPPTPTPTPVASGGGGGDGNSDGGSGGSSGGGTIWAGGGGGDGNSDGGSGGSSGGGTIWAGGGGGGSSDGGSGGSSGGGTIWAGGGGGGSSDGGSGGSGGSGSTWAGGAGGAGETCSDPAVTGIINNTIISSGSGGDGGGIYNNSIITLDNTTINRNDSGDGGGGIYNNSIIIVNNTIISSTNSGEGSDGGCIIIGGSPYILNNTIISSGGGGRYFIHSNQTPTTIISPGISTEFGSTPGMPAIVYQGGAGLIVGQNGQSLVGSPVNIDSGMASQAAMSHYATTVVGENNIVDLGDLPIGDYRLVIQPDGGEEIEAFIRVVDSSEITTLPNTGAGSVPVGGSMIVAFMAGALMLGATVGLIGVNRRHRVTR